MIRRNPATDEPLIINSFWLSLSHFLEFLIILSLVDNLAFLGWFTISSLTTVLIIYLAVLPLSDVTRIVTLF